MSVKKELSNEKEFVKTFENSIEVSHKETSNRIELRTNRGTRSYSVDSKKGVQLKNICYKKGSDGKSLIDFAKQEFNF